MNEPKTLGEKVRAARKALHLTQSALCGDVITRNLLSRIETGDITPSLGTLRFLSERLSLPVGYLLSEKDDLAEYRKPLLMEELRSRCRAKDWKGVDDLAAEESLDNDESHLILCESAVRQCVEAYRSGKPELASSFFERAEHHAAKTIYPTELLLAEASLYAGLSASSENGTASAFFDRCRHFLIGSAWEERYLLHSVMEYAENGKTDAAKTMLSLHPSMTAAYSEAANAWIDAASGNIQNAVARLLPLLDSKAFTDDPTLAYRCAEKAEQLAAASDDYKTAYRCAKMKQELEKKLRIKPAVPLSGEKKEHRGENS